MPVQCLIRKLTRAQVDKAIADAKVKIAVTVADRSGVLLLVVTAPENDGKDPAANLVLQRIADMDAAIMQQEREALTAKLAAERAAKLSATNER